MSKNNPDKLFFTKTLLLWHKDENERCFPWTVTTDPYKIWLSEVILQQTRVAQGLPYYEKFVGTYPDIHQLAEAPDEEVFRLWEGLGYYSRCRNLLATARYISRELDGRFPNRYDEIRALKGVGPYTAAAIASFAFGLPYAVVDGNVFRVLSRFFGISTAIDSGAGRKRFSELATSLLPDNHPGSYNQAIMDFGATVCVPTSPDCVQCALSPRCSAYRENLVALLPVKEKKMRVARRYFHYFLLLTGEEVFIRQRNKKDIWQDLFEFYCIEKQDKFTDAHQWKVVAPLIEKKELSVYCTTQRLTHQLVSSEFHILHLKKKPAHLSDGRWIRKDQLRKFAFPRTIVSFLNRKNYF